MLNPDARLSELSASRHLVCCVSVLPSDDSAFDVPGLRFFDAGNAHLFFGRDRQVDDLLDKLSSARFVGVIGLSGSGKSSLVRAGLIPELRAGFTWRIATCKPGINPIHELAEALQSKWDGAGAELTLRRGPLGLRDTGLQLRLRPGQNLLLIVDQFEELFRFESTGGRSDEASAFVRLLLEGASQTEVQIYVLITMRSDYLGRCSQFRDLPERLNEGLYLVPRMRRQQLELAITGPVGIAGVEIAPRLVQRLLNDVGDDPDQLPVLQHALLRTWTRWRENGADGPLDLAHCTNLQSSLEDHAEEIYRNLPGNEQSLAKIIFCRLTETNETSEVRRPALVSELVDVSGASIELVTKVLSVFRAEDVSFLTPEPARSLNRDTQIDITHESLIRQWARLRGWAKQEAVDRDIYVRTERRARLAKAADDCLPSFMTLLDSGADFRRHAPVTIVAVEEGALQAQGKPRLFRRHSAGGEQT